jgi:hypothetical protein
MRRLPFRRHYHVLGAVLRFRGSPRDDLVRVESTSDYKFREGQSAAFLCRFLLWEGFTLVLEYACDKIMGVLLVEICLRYA